MNICVQVTVWTCFHFPQVTPRRGGHLLLGNTDRLETDFWFLVYMSNQANVKHSPVVWLCVKDRQFLLSQSLHKCLYHICIEFFLGMWLNQPAHCF